MVSSTKQDAQSRIQEATARAQWATAAATETVLGLRAEGLAGRDWYKRSFDLTVLVLAHILLLPLWLLLWTAVPLAIWLEDRGPIFFTQLRVGKGGRVFRMYKFRSMVREAEALTGPVWSCENDPRVTRVGRFLRAHALDELPQLLNVWKGDLSLVGPRPERPEFVAEFTRQVPGFARRHQVRPGLTGLAQVYGCYTSRPRHKLRYDLLYIRRMCLWLDIKLLVVSVLVTFKGHWQASERHVR